MKTLDALDWLQSHLLKPSTPSGKRRRVEIELTGDRSYATLMEESKAIETADGQTLHYAVNQLVALLEGIDGVVNVRFYCGAYAYAELAPSDSGPPDCGAEGTFVVSAQEWYEGSVSHNCPKCGAELTQGNDELGLVEEES